MRFLRALAAGLMLSAVAFSFPAFAQQHPAHREFHALHFPIDPGQFSDTLSDYEREIYQLIEDLGEVRLKRALGCSPETMQALNTEIGDLKDQLTMLKWQRAGAREYLRWALKTNQPEETIAERLAMLLDYEDQIADVLARMVRESQYVLSVADSAKLYLFVDDFERFIGKRIEQAIEGAEHKRANETAADTGDAPADSDSGRERFEDLVRQDNRDVPLAEYAGEDVIKLVDALMSVRLAQALDLSSEEAASLSARVGSYKDQLHELKWQIGANRNLLRETIATGAPDKAIQEQLDDLLMQEKAVAGLIRDFVEGAQKDVTVAQSAKLYLFLGDFELYIINLLERANW